MKSLKPCAIYKGDVLEEKSSSPYNRFLKGVKMMKRSRSTTMHIIAMSIGIAIVIVPLLVYAGSKTPLDVTVLFFNDVHGHLMPFKVKTNGSKEEVGGIARLATLIKKIRAENSQKNIRTIVLIAGDILQGTPMSTVFKGRPDVECFNAMEVDAMTVGNHEFDFGLNNFLDLKEMASFPFLSSNIIFKETGKRICEPSASFKLTSDITLSVIGVTTKDMLNTTKRENVKDLYVLDSVQAVKNAFDRLKDMGPLVLLSHSKYQTDRSIAMAVPELSAIIGGHDQILLSPFRQVGKVPIFQAFEKCRYLGRMDLKIDPVSKTARLVKSAYIPVTAGIEADSQIEQIVKGYHAQLDRKFGEVIGESRTFFEGEREKVRYEETALGNFVTDIMREYTGADIALLNGGSLRASIDMGPITLEDVFKAMPYSNEIVLLDLTGMEVMQVLIRSVQGTRDDEDGGFLHVSGICFTIRGHEVDDVRSISNNIPIDPKKIYRVAITDFLASGGDGYELFVGKPRENTRLPLRELIIDTIRARAYIAGRVEGRIVRVEEK